MQQNCLIFKYDLGLSFKKIKELTRPFVQMHDLPAAGGHAFLNNADILPFEQMPGIGVFSPQIMLGVCDRYRLHHLRRLNHLLFNTIANSTNAIAAYENAVLSVLMPMARKAMPRVRKTIEKFRLRGSII